MTTFKAVRVGTKLLSVNSDAKTIKGNSYGVLTAILYLAPSSSSGRNVCPHASPGCIMACLNTAGRGIMASIQEARKRKTLWFFSDRAGFMAQLEADIRLLMRKAEANGMRPAVRLNGTSDLPWENIRNPAKGLTLLETFPGVQFYDYTKSEARALACAEGKMPGNYQLTFSRSETNGDACERVMDAGGNVSVVFESVPKTWQGKRCVDGDKSDLRFKDPKGVVVGLSAKGKGKADTSGFVVRQ